MRPTAVAPRLAAMMFVQYFVWGAWYVTAPAYLTRIGFTPEDIGWTYSVGPIAGMLSPFLVGAITDRLFAVERMLGLLHLAGAAAMFVALQVMRGAGPEPALVNLAFFAHMLCFFPTLALSNSLTLCNVGQAQRSFPWIRVFGTIGWIAAGWAVGRTGSGESAGMFELAIVAGVVLGLYAWTLPHTPPLAGQPRPALRELLGLDALVLLRRPGFAVFLVSSFLICIPLAFYYQLAARAVQVTGFADVATTMTFGQMSEILFMLLMPLFFVRLGIKWMLLAGMAAWALRYALFAAGTPAGRQDLVLAGVLLHGICYDFFFVTGQIYTDRVAPPALRSQAQGLLVLFTLGLGMLIGAQVAGRVETIATPPESIAAATRAEALGQQIARAPAADVDLAALRAEQDRAVQESLARKDWRLIWGLPGLGAAIVLLLFALVFRAPPRAPD